MQRCLNNEPADYYLAGTLPYLDYREVVCGSRRWSHYSSRTGWFLTLIIDLIHMQ